MRRRSNQGFTLAEVLLTLAIIGVVAAMTIPTLLSSTNQQELKVALKKSMSVLNQAISMSIALDATDAATCDGCSATGDNGANALANYFKSRLNVIAEGADGNSFYTADGALYKFMKNGAACTTGELDPDAANCVVEVDVNGDKNPNEDSGMSGSDYLYKDQYKLIITDSSVLPADDADNAAVGDVAGAALYQ